MNFFFLAVQWRGGCVFFALFCSKKSEILLSAMLHLAEPADAGR